MARRAQGAAMKGAAMKGNCTNCGHFMDLNAPSSVVEYSVTLSDESTRIQRQRRTGRQWCSATCEDDTLQHERAQRMEQRRR